jgi:FkbM family methyltransferase
VRSPTDAIETLKRAVHAGTLQYVEKVPFKRGKHRLLKALHSVVGPALYEIGGLKLSLSPRHLIDGFIIREGAFHPELVRFIEASMAGGGGFIDIGANIGFLSLVAARAGGARSHVYAFEPSKREYGVLLLHLALNELMNVTAFPYGVGEVQQESTLWLSGLDNPSMNSRFAPAGAVGSISINLAPIDALLPAETLRGVRCVKIDVEGDECSVLGGFARVMPLLKEASFIVEVAPQHLARAGRTPDDVYALFTKHGFRPCHKSRPTDDAWDEVFVGNDAPDPPGLWF